VAIEVFKQTPNVSPRVRVNERLGVVLHHSCGGYEGGVEWILNPKSQVSYHVLIAPDGRRTVFAEDSRVCWHAGKSQWRGREFCNAFTIGVAFTGDTNDRELTDAEVASALEYLLPRMKRYGWTVADITTHRHVSPGRKDDVSPAAERRVLEALKKAL
jgi:AmpD protein